MDLEQDVARGEDRIVVSEILDGSRFRLANPLDEEADKAYMKYLRALRLGKAPARILGWTFGSDDAALADVTVRAVGGGGNYETRSGAHGIFEFPDVLPGRYQLTVSSDGYSSLESSEEVEVVPAGCAVESFLLFFDGVIRGVVKDTHGSPQRVRVDLVHIDEDEDSPYDSRQTDEEGKFAFHRIDPGRYRIGINLLQQMPRQFYPKLYAPGVEEAKLAPEVTVSREQPSTEANFWLPDPKIRDFEINVYWPNGSVVKDATLKLIYGRWPDNTDTRPDAGGALSFHGYADLEYRLTAYARDPHSGDLMACADEIVLRGTDKVRLRLVLSEKYVEPVLP